MIDPVVEPFGLNLMGNHDFFVARQKFDRFNYRFDGEKYFEIHNSSDGNYKLDEYYVTNRWDLANRQAKLTPYSRIEAVSTLGDPMGAWARDPKHPENVQVNRPRT